MTTTSGSQSTVLHNNSALLGAPGQNSSDPGINIGNPPPGNPGTTNYGNQTNPASVQFYNLGSNNTGVANNTGPGGTTGAPCQPGQRGQWQPRLRRANHRPGHSGINIASIGNTTPAGNPLTGTSAPTA
jgi:hypothetical protein